MTSIHHPSVLIKYLLISIISVSFVFSAQAQASNSELTEYYTRIMSKIDSGFQITQADPKYKEESTVTLCKKVHIGLLKSYTRGLLYPVRRIVRERILLQDEAALQEFSEFYFPGSGIVGITIIKPSGETHEVDFKEAIQVETDVPRRFRDRYRNDSYSKIAVSNLEVGDVIDFHKCYVDLVDNFDLFSTLAEDNPIQHLEFYLDFYPEWDLYCYSYNGAPKFNFEVGKGFGIKGFPSDKVDRYSFSASGLDATKDEPWSYALLNEPYIKVKGVSKSLQKIYRPAEDEQAAIDIHRLLKKQRKFAKTYTTLIYQMVDPELDRAKLSNKPFADKIETIYRIMRLQIIKTIIGPDQMKELNSKGYHKSLTREYMQLNDSFFAFSMISFLNKYNIPNELVFAVPRYFGDTKNVLFTDEYQLGVYVPATRKYYWAMDNYRAAGETPIDLYGAQVLRIPSGEIGSSKALVFESSIPSSSYTKNVRSINQKVKIDEENNLTFDNTMSFTGAYKTTYDSYFLYNTECYLNELIEFSAERFLKKLDPSHPKYKDQRDGTWHAKDKEFQDTHNEMIKEWLNRYYEDVEVTDYRVVECGMNSFDTTLVVDADFKSSGLISKAGKNLAFEIGSLIMDIPEVDDRYREERFYDIEIDYPYSQQYTIEIELPDGLTAKGVNALNMSNSNEFTSFVSKAEVIDNVIQLDIQLDFKVQSISKDHWNEFIAPLDTAFDFSKKKIILAKTN